jgi:hypothetical protein
MLDRAIYTHRTRGWAGPIVDLHAVVTRKILPLTEKAPIIEPAVYHFADSTTKAQFLFLKLFNS